MRALTYVDNVYLIDTKMFGYEGFNSAYLIRGKELALIDTGPASSIEVIRAGIKGHGFDINEISHIFVTHEHNDHSGNAGKLLKENPRAKVYANPIDSEHLIDPGKERAWMKSIMVPDMMARFGEMEPVPASRFVALKDGDTFDLGEGERLRIIVAPGHQPSGIVIYSEKTQGMFINDLVGLNLADCGAAWMFTPPRSDVMQITQSLQKIMKLPISRLYLGHFGIWNNPKEVIQGALNRIDRLMEIGAKCIKEGKPEEIEPRVLAFLKPETEKIKAVRGSEGLYKYVSGELIPHLGGNFAKYYLATIK